MANEVRIPSLGESVTEATIGRWMKQDGDLVRVDEAILELESDKANMDLAAESSGVLHIVKPAGETVHVGDVVATIEAGAAARSVPAKGATSVGSSSAAPASGIGVGDAAARPATASPAAAPSPASTAASSPSSAHGATAPPSLNDAAGRPLSPAVRRIASEEGVDLSATTGSGLGGRVTKADVLEMLEQRASGGREAGTANAAAPDVSAARATVTPISAATAPAGSAAAGRVTAPSVPAAAAAAAEERVPMSRLRQVIARRLVEAQHTAAILTTFNEVDMSGVLELRARFKESFQKQHGVALGFMSFFVAACCAATREVPELNARLDGTDVVYSRAVHMGVAVGTGRGLVVPVVRDADRLTFAEIEREIARLAGLAKDAKLAPDDLAGATFTISNGGVYGSLLSTPILNPPQSGILGMHKIEKRPVVVDDQIVVRPMMYLALSYDHRLIDGKGAVTFLVHVKEKIEDPTRLLLGL